MFLVPMVLPHSSNDLSIAVVIDLDLSFLLFYSNLYPYYTLEWLLYSSPCLSYLGHRYNPHTGVLWVLAAGTLYMAVHTPSKRRNCATYCHLLGIQDCFITPKPRELMSKPLLSLYLSPSVPLVMVLCIIVCLACTQPLGNILYGEK